MARARRALPGSRTKSTSGPPKGGRSGYLNAAASGKKPGFSPAPRPGGPMPKTAGGSQNASRHKHHRPTRLGPEYGVPESKSDSSSFAEAGPAADAANRAACEAEVERASMGMPVGGTAGPNTRPTKR